MTLVKEFLQIWTISFVTLCGALIFLDMFCGYIDNDLELLSPKKEAIIAGIASLIQALGILFVVTIFSKATQPLAARSLFFPTIVVVLGYKLSHLEWRTSNVACLLIFQISLAFFLVSLRLGNFTAAIVVLFVVSVIMTIIAWILRNL